MLHHTITEKTKALLQSRGEGAIDRHCIIVYILHTAIVIILICAQFMGLGGSQEILPKALSVLHLAVCLIAFTLWYSHRLSIPGAFSLVALTAQGIFVCRLIYFAHVRPEHFLQFILLNQMASLLAVVFLVMCFVKIHAIYCCSHQSDSLCMHSNLSEGACPVEYLWLLRGCTVLSLRAGRTATPQRATRTDGEQMDALPRNGTDARRQAQRTGD